MIKSKKGLYLMPLMSIACNYPPSLQKYSVLNKTRVNSEWQQNFMDLTDLGQLIQDVCIRKYMDTLTYSAFSNILFCVQSKLYSYYSSKYDDNQVIDEDEKYPKVLGEMIASAFKYLQIPRKNIVSMVNMIKFTKKHRDHNNIVEVFSIIVDRIFKNKKEPQNEVQDIIDNVIMLVDKTKEFRNEMINAISIDLRYKKMFKSISNSFSSSMYKIAADKKVFTESMKDNICYSLVSSYFNRIYPPRKFNIKHGKKQDKLSATDELELLISHDEAYSKYKMALSQIVDGEIEYLRTTYGESLNTYPKIFSKLISYFQKASEKLKDESNSYANSVKNNKSILKDLIKYEEEKEAHLNLSKLEKGESLIIRSNFTKRRKPSENSKSSKSSRSKSK